MTRKTQIIRSRDLSRIGLREGDLERRVIIVVGYGPGELLPPYDCCDRRDVDRVHDYINGGDGVIKRRYSLDDLEIMRLFGRRPPKLVEVVGALADCCVALTANNFVEHGSFVYINPSLTITPKRQRYPAYWIGRIQLQMLLSKYPERRCFIYGKDLIFYREDSIGS